MSVAVAVVACYGLFSLVGGLIGYLKANSTASLIAGSASGVLLLLCAYGMGHGSRAAALGSFVMAVVLGARFLGTWLKRHRVSVPLFGVGAATLLSSIGTGVTALEINRSLEAQGCPDACPSEKRGEYARERNLGVATDALLGIGAALVVSAVIVYAIEVKRDQRKRLAQSR